MPASGILPLNPDHEERPSMNSQQTCPILALVTLALGIHVQAAQNSFTYQGRLSSGGSPASGQYEMNFTLYDAFTNGTAIGAQAVAPVPVTNGLFTVLLDFGSNAFNGDPRWLEIAVTVFGSDQPVTVVQPRQALTASPYALHAANAANLVNSANAPLDIKVNGIVRALRIEPTGPLGYSTPNIIGGNARNSVGTNVQGAFIGGGGLYGGSDDRYPNRVAADFGAIVGGYGNSISDEAGFIGAGYNNRIALGAYFSAIGGGHLSRIESDSYGSFIGGGIFNGIEQRSEMSVVSGGYQNTVLSNSPNAAIAGGYWNFIGPSAHGSTISGGTSNRASSFAATIGGGEDNQIGLTANHATVAGGFQNTNNSYRGTIAGGEGNRALAVWATVGGGQGNLSGGDYVVIAGGERNAVLSDYGAILGGSHNTNYGSSGSIGGGSDNSTASQFATVPGGVGNGALGSFSFAAGYYARANHNGAFVWADNRVTLDDDFIPFESTTNNEFSVRSTGGVRFVSGIDAINGAPMAGVALAPGAGGWSSLSDRHAKENIQSASARDILEKVAALPVATWNYKSQDQSIRHIGPMAQDFHAAFGVGENERTISTVDADGVALAAIRGLNEKMDEENRALRAALKVRATEIDELKKGLTELRALLQKR
jgi:trimeric autotransporter adhesin